MHPYICVRYCYVLENIILDQSGYFYLADFGVSYVSDEAADLEYTLACNLSSGMLPLS